MGYVRHPSYYKEFQCIGSNCTDNCCIGWEIDIDADTLSYYQQVDGTFGQRLTQNIAPPTANEKAHFILKSMERCPFLNNCNLCDIFIKLGEEHLSQICTDHPRFYEWFSGGREEGLGLCCEAAAELILQKTDAVQWDTSYDDEENERISEDIAALEQALFSMREQLFHIVKPTTETIFDSKINQLYRSALLMQEQYDNLLYPFPKMEEAEPIPSPNWSKFFWQEHVLQSLLDRLLSLEINDPSWRELLTMAKSSVSEIIRYREDFLQYYRQNLYEYNQLLIYFISRYFMKTLDDDLLLERINFSLISVSMIQLLDIFLWLKNSVLTHWQQICLCKLYSKEIEYNTDNVACISGYVLNA